MKYKIEMRLLTEKNEETGRRVVILDNIPNLNLGELIYNSLFEFFGVEKSKYKHKEIINYK